MTRFRYAADPLCLASCAIYVANCWVWKPQAHSAFFGGHFNDLLLIPCALPFVLWLHRRLGWRTHDRPPEGGEVALHLCVWAVVAEALAPTLFHATGDVLDVLAYAAGALGSWMCWQLPRFAPNERARRAPTAPTYARDDEQQGWRKLF